MYDCLETQDVGMLQERDHAGILRASRLTCEPLVLGPALAMLRRPGVVCFSWKFSSPKVLHPPTHIDPLSGDVSWGEPPRQMESRINFLPAPREGVGPFPPMPS
jgi:hypothetical protein